jgi:hypothetical protein
MKQRKSSAQFYADRATGREAEELIADWLQLDPAMKCSKGCQLYGQAVRYRSER